MTFLLVYGVTTLILTIMLGGVYLAWRIDKGRPTTPEWTDQALNSFPREHTGAHRLVGARAESSGYQPRRGMDEIPPSILDPISRMTPVERARELVRQLGQEHYSPWRGVADRRKRIWLQRYTIAARHGIPMLLGTFQRPALP